MVCPKCGEKTKVVDNSHNLHDNETYRQRRCVECGHTFFSCEKVVETNAIKADWYNNHRTTLRKFK